MMIIDFTLNYTKRTPDGKVEAGTSEYKGKSQFENSLIISTKFVNCIDFRQFLHFDIKRINLFIDFSDSNFFTLLLYFDEL